MKTTALTIFITPLKGDEIRIEKACTLKQAVTLAKKEARKALNNGGMLVFINIQTRGIYDTIETIAHIEATKEARRVVFSDEKPAAETFAVCWGVEYNEEDGESNAIAETTSEADAKEFAENESKDNNCRMCVVRKSDNKVIAIYDNTTPSTSDTMNTETKTMNEANETLTAIIARPLDYLKANGITEDAKFRYMLLDRLQQDVTYYLGYGNRCARQLWAGDETKQIKIMVALWMAAPEPPEWLTFDQISEYAKQMNVAI